MSYRETDLQFVAETIASTKHKQQEALKLLKDRPELMDEFLENERIFKRLWSEQELIVKISPYMLFQVLLRQVRRDLKGKLYIYEVGLKGERLPVFEAPQVVEFLHEEGILEYLAQMLASFTKTQSAVIYWQEHGQWYRKRFSDIEMDDMIFLARLVEPALRPLLFKRIADIALFLSGIYPQYATLFISKPKTFYSGRRTIRDYEQEGPTFYKMAAEHIEEPTIRYACKRLSQNFTLARRALNTLSESYLSGLQDRLKGIPLTGD